MNQREKEQYLREYMALKAVGKPFFPYAVAKDGMMAIVVMAAIIAMSLVLGAELGPKADPTRTEGQLIAQLTRERDHLRVELDKAQLVIEVQKKVSERVLKVPNAPATALSG